MAGRVKVLIDAIVAQRANGNPVLVNTTRTKLVLKGIDVAKYGATSPDDPIVIAKLQRVAVEFGVKV